METPDGSTTLLLVKACCDEVRHLAGDAAEIGVYRGDSAEMICRELPTSTVWLFDTFCGMPTELLQTCDSHFFGAFRNTSEGFVRERLSVYPNASIISGVFPATARNINTPLRFAHIDVDIYLTTLSALWWAWAKLVPGGIMLCDDYLCGSCPGALRAVNEFAERAGVHIEEKLLRARFIKPGGLTTCRR